MTLRTAKITTKIPSPRSFGTIKNQLRPAAPALNRSAAFFGFPSSCQSHPVPKPRVLCVLVVN
jgi:hypothetical protein